MEDSRKESIDEERHYRDKGECDIKTCDNHAVCDRLVGDGIYEREDKALDSSR